METHLYMQVDVQLHCGYTLGPFSIGRSFFSVIDTIKSELISCRAQILFCQSGHSPIYILISMPVGCHYILQFNASLQILQSVSYSLLPWLHGEECCEIQLRGSLRARISALSTPCDVHNFFGNPLEEITFDGKTVLVYEGVAFHFVCKKTSCVKNFEKIQLVPLSGSKLYLLSQHKLPPLSQVIQSARTMLDLHLPQISFVVNSSSGMATGISMESSCASLELLELGRKNVLSTKTTVYFGDRLEDVLSKLGAPSSVYYKNRDYPMYSSSEGMIDQLVTASQLKHMSDVFLTYPKLGLDLLLDSSQNRVVKVILHCNNPCQYDFATHSRCFFNFSISENGLSTSMDSTKTFLISPETSWSTVLTYVQPNFFRKLNTVHYSSSTNLFLDTTLYCLFDQIIVDITRSDTIAKLTLVTPRGVSSGSQNQSAEQRNCNIDTQAGEQDVTMTNQGTSVCGDATVEADHNEDILSSGDEIFHSAENSIRNGSFESAHTSVMHCSVVEHNPAMEEQDLPITIGANVNIIRSEPNLSSSTASTSIGLTTVYEFDDHDLSPCTMPAQGSYVAIVYESQTMRIVNAYIEETVVGDVNSYSPEVGSFDFISYSEMIESQEAIYSTNKPEPALYSSSMAQAKAGKDTGEFEPAEPEFSYKPKSSDINLPIEDMSTSRTLALSHDMGLLTQYKPRKIRTAGGVSSQVGEKLIEQSEDPQKQSPISPGRYTIQNRSGLLLSTREEARRRLLCHTKSSQQHVRQKYIPTKKENIPIIDEDESARFSDRDDSVSESKVGSQLGPACQFSSPHQSSELLPTILDSQLNCVLQPLPYTDATESDQNEQIIVSSIKSGKNELELHNLTQSQSHNEDSTDSLANSSMLPLTVMTVPDKITQSKPGSHGHGV